jgi:hypothetical protein
MTKKNTTANETIVGETVETPAPEAEEKAFVLNWKKIGKIAAYSSALVGVGLLIGVAVTSTEEDEEDFVETAE